MKGRKKLPDNIKALRGTDQPCRMTDKPAVQGATVIKLPKVGLKGTAKKVFAVVATELMHNNLLDVYGVDMVVAYAREMALYHDMMAEIEKEGVTIGHDQDGCRYADQPEAQGCRRSSRCRQVAGCGVWHDAIKPQPSVSNTQRQHTQG